MKENGFCPGCGRHCSFDNPGCERGATYFRTGELAQDEQHQWRPYGTYPPHYPAAGTSDKLIHNFRDIGHMIRWQYEGKTSQNRILIILSESHTLTQKALTEQLGIQPGSASEVLSKLEDAGLITRTQNESDRRTTDIRLTDAGNALALETAQQRQKRHEAMFTCLSAEEQQTLLLLLEKIHEDWKRRFSPPAERGQHGKHEHRGGKHHKGLPHHDP